MTQKVPEEFRIPQQVMQGTPQNRYKKSPVPHIASIEDTIKMRNPIFSDFDYSTVQSPTNKNRFVPEPLNQVDYMAFVPKTYVKIRSGKIVQVDSGAIRRNNAPVQGDYFEESSKAAPTYSRPMYANLTNYEPRQEMTPKANVEYAIKPEKPLGSPKNMEHFTTRSPVLVKGDKIIEKTNHYVPYESLQRGIKASLGEAAWKSEVHNIASGSQGGMTPSDKGRYEARNTSLVEPKYMAYNEPRSYPESKPYVHPRYEISSIF